MDRPMVNVYETDADGVEQLVYREMNDEEYAQWQVDVAAAASAPAPVNPLVAQVDSMSDEDKAALKAALGVA